MRTLATAACALCLCLLPCLASGGGLALDASNHRYADKEAGFSFALPPGQWHAEKSADGRTVIYDRAIDDANVTRIDAYACSIDKNIPLQNLIDEEEQGYMDVLEEKIAPDKSGFILTTASCVDDIFRIHHIHYFRSENKVIVFAISTALSQLIKALACPISIFF